MRIHLIIIAIIVNCTISSFAQSFIFLDTITINANLTEENSGGEFNLTDCTYTRWNYIIPTTGFYWDIAYSPTGDYYAYATPQGNTTLEPGLYRMNPGQTLLYRGDFENNDSITAVACAWGPEVYAAGTGISSYNALTGEFEYLGDLPPDMHAGGDMTHRDGAYYLSTKNNTLVEVDLENPMNSTVFMTFPDGFPLVDAMVSYTWGCDSIDTYIITRSENTSTIYLLDFDTQILTEVCQTDLYIFGAASEMDCLSNGCAIGIDLDANDDSGAIDNDYFGDTTCTGPIPIVDSDILVAADTLIDSIWFFLGIIGPDNADEEFFILEDNYLNITITGSGSRRITLYNDGNASFTEFEDALRSVVYVNTADVPIDGLREIWFRAFTFSFESQTAVSNFYVDNDIIEVTPDITDVSCFESIDGSAILSATGGFAPYTFFWEGGIESDMRNDLSPGVYMITAEDSEGCPKEFSIEIGEPPLLTASINAISDTICGPSGVLNAQIEGGTEPYTVEWNTGDTEEEISNLEPGDYTLMVLDSNNCMAEASFTLFAYDTIFVNQQEILCEGESFLFNGENLTVDTSLCVAFNSINGCDSIHCLDLQFLDTVLVQENKQLCFGESLNIDGTILETDTTACFVYTGVNGCDSTYCVTLNISGGITEFAEAICEGDNYDFEGILLSSTGIYFDTLQNQEGCDSILALDLIVNPLPDISFSTIGNLCNDDEVEINAGNFVTYDWSTGASSSSITVMSPGMYSVVVLDQNNCENSASIDISDEGIQEVFFSVIDPSCFGESDGLIQIDSILGGNPSYLYTIDNQVFQQSNQFSNLSAGAFTILVEDAAGCLFEVQANLNDPPQLIAELGQDQNIQLGDSITLEVFTNINPEKIEWTSSELLSCDTCQSIQIRPFESTTVEVTITDDLGCTASDVILVNVDKSGGIYIPNAFSPNGDGINDEFTIFTNESVSRIVSFQVFNRWGGLVHQVTDTNPNDPQFAWDGKFQGKVAQTGVYIYSLEVERIDGNIQLKEGEIILIN